MAGIQQDINIFINKAQRKVAELSHEVRDFSNQGLCIDEIVDLIQELNASVSLFQYDKFDLTDNESYEVISYLTKKANLTVLPFSYFDTSCLVDNVQLPGGYVLGPQGEDGDNGWSQVFAVISDGATREVLRLIDWIGGTGVKPGNIGKYISDSGYVSTPAEAKNIKGNIGSAGAAGTNGWSAVYALITDGDRIVFKVIGWFGGTGTPPASGFYIGPSGPVSDISQAQDLRGIQGIQGPKGDKGDKGDQGQSVYPYIAYASDDIGTDFTTTFDPALNYIAIKITTTPIPSPSSGDFVGLWFKWKGDVGPAFQVDARGTLADRTLYDSVSVPFAYLAMDTGNIYFKESNTPGDWSAPVSFVGDKGWSPLPLPVEDGDRVVLQISDWLGGEGAKPDIGGYLAIGGITYDIDLAYNFKGAKGDMFFPNVEGNIADRSTYDNQQKDFVFHALDEGKVYKKNSNTSGDWSSGFTWRGSPGVGGSPGTNSYTSTTASFTQPSAGSNVAINVINSTWIGAGQILFIETGGFYQVISIDSSTAITIKNLGYVGNVSPGATVNTSKKVSPAGPESDNTDSIARDGSRPPVSDVDWGSKGINNLSSLRGLNLEIIAETDTTLLIKSDGNNGGIYLYYKNSGLSIDIFTFLIENNDAPNLEINTANGNLKLISQNGLIELKTTGSSALFDLSNLTTNKTVKLQDKNYTALADITDITRKSYTDNISGTVIIDLSQGDIFYLTLTGNVTSFSFINETLNADYIFVFIKNTTNYTLTWAVGKYLFPFGSAPTTTDPTSNGTLPAYSKDIFTGLCTEAGRLDIVRTPDLQRN